MDREKRNFQSLVGHEKSKLMMAQQKAFGAFRTGPESSPLGWS